jgi:acetoin utilization deacetylase AcuC-like enzyme
MGAPLLFTHPSSLLHDTGAHPERAARLVAIERELEERADLAFERRESPAAGRELIEAVHDPAYVAAIEAFCARGGGYLDVDTVAVPESFEAALHATGGTAAMVDALCAREAQTGFAIHRPPGHHAERAEAMGFCLFNNVAVAARRALDAHGLQRVLIVDWDVHHGNGTNQIFHASDAVLFLSVHQWPLYPGTGLAGDAGSGPGEGYTVNVPVPAGSGDEVFVSVMTHLAMPLARAWEPQLVLVSAGYDAHRDDPLAGCRVTDGGYRRMAQTLRTLAADLDAPLGLVLEGGYDLAALSRSVATTLEVLAAPPAREGPALEPHPLVVQATRALGDPWPSLLAPASR